MKKKLTKEVARKVLEVVDAGLVSGLGEAKPGHMCVEAAVCYALEEPHGDKPSCVGSAVRAFKIRLNDSNWSSDEARSKGMRLLAIAQLGSDEIDQQAFRKEVTFQTIKQILPIALRAAASMIPAHKEALEICAVACEIIKDLAQGRTAAKQAKTAAAYAYAAYAAAAADAAAAAAAYAAAAYAADADDAADAAAADAAAAAAAADAAADAAAAAAAYAKKQARDKVLTLAADIGLKALKKLKSQGCKWLSLAA